jgi:hypothetical protein
VLVLGARYIMKPKEGKKVVSSCAWWSQKEEKDCVITFWLSELSLIQWTGCQITCSLRLSLLKIFMKKKPKKPVFLSSLRTHPPPMEKEWASWLPCLKCRAELSSDLILGPFIWKRSPPWGLNPKDNCIIHTRHAASQTTQNQNCKRLCYGV